MKYRKRKGKGVVYIIICYSFSKLLIHTHTAVPIVQMTPSTMMEEENATFNCIVLADPEATVTFEFANETLTSGEKYAITKSSGSEYYIVIYTLEITNVMISDTGEYWCVATNSHGTAHDGAVLQVLGLFITTYIGTYESTTIPHSLFVCLSYFTIPLLSSFIICRLCFLALSFLHPENVFLLFNLLLQLTAIDTVAILLLQNSGYSWDNQNLYIELIMKLQ